MIDRVPVAEQKGWDKLATMEDAFNYYCEGLKFSGRAWRRAKLATWIAVFASVASLAELAVILVFLL